jgi:hypothetical protein
MRDAINYPHCVRIYWKYGDTNTKWDEKCIWAIETFGCPGDKFITHVCEDFMDFMFKDSKDATHFSLVNL